jgi:hypothetical protein
MSTNLSQNLVREGYLGREQGYLGREQGYLGKEQTFLSKEQLEQDFLSKGYSQGTMSQGTMSPTTLEKVEKPLVVKEKIFPTERTEIQPIIYRDREQMEVHQVVQPLTETDIAPTEIRRTELPASNMSFKQPGVPPPPQREFSERIVAPLNATTVEKPAIVHEEVHKKVIEEVQPVLYKETLKPTVIEATKPIYEKIEEAPVYIEEVRPIKDLGTQYLQEGQKLQQGFAEAGRQGAKAHPLMGGAPLSQKSI